MSQFVLLFRTNPEDRRGAHGTPELAARSMAAFMEWVRDLDAKGHIAHPGNPLGDEGKVIRGDAKVVTDGPHVEAKDYVAGFFVIEARDLDHAVELCMGCPMLAGNSGVEVRPVARIPS
jgi:hypothetical protein